MSCSDVRERFHLFALLFVVVLQTMKEYGWREESFWSLAPDCLTVLGAEIIVDWLKHAFITRFNEVSAEVYKDYTISLAYDLAQTKEKQAFRKATIMAYQMSIHRSENHFSSLKKDVFPPYDTPIFFTLHATCFPLLCLLCIYCTVPFKLKFSLNLSSFSLFLYVFLFFLSLFLYFSL